MNYNNIPIDILKIVKYYFDQINEYVRYVKYKKPCKRFINNLKLYNLSIKYLRKNDFKLYMLIDLNKKKLVSKYDLNYDSHPLLINHMKSKYKIYSEDPIMFIFDCPIHCICGAMIKKLCFIECEETKEALIVGRKCCESFIPFFLEKEKLFKKESMENKRKNKKIKRKLHKDLNKYFKNDDSHYKKYCKKCHHEKTKYNSCYFCNTCNLGNCVDCNKYFKPIGTYKIYNKCFSCNRSNYNNCPLCNKRKKKEYQVCYNCYDLNNEVSFLFST